MPIDACDSLRGEPLGELSGHSFHAATVRRKIMGDERDPHQR